MKKFFSYCLVGLLLFVLAALLLPINPRPTKKALKTMRCYVEIASIARGLESYKTNFLVYPSESSLSLWKQLSGDNPQKMVFVSRNASSLDTNGEFLDPWKNPYAISFPASNTFVISSAGQDRVFGTKDDIAFNSLSNGFVKP